MSKGLECAGQFWFAFASCRVHDFALRREHVASAAGRIVMRK